MHVKRNIMVPDYAGSHSDHSTHKFRNHLQLKVLYGTDGSYITEMPTALLSKETPNPPFISAKHQ